MCVCVCACVSVCVPLQFFRVFQFSTRSLPRLQTNLAGGGENKMSRFKVGIGSFKFLIGGIREKITE